MSLYAAAAADVGWASECRAPPRERGATVGLRGRAAADRHTNFRTHARVAAATGQGGAASGAPGQKGGSAGGSPVRHAHAGRLAAGAPRRVLGWGRGADGGPPSCACVARGPEPVAAVHRGSHRWRCAAACFQSAGAGVLVGARERRPARAAARPRLCSPPPPGQVPHPRAHRPQGFRRARAVDFEWCAPPRPGNTDGASVPRSGWLMGSLPRCVASAVAWGPPTPGGLAGPPVSRRERGRGLARHRRRCSARAD